MIVRLLDVTTPRSDGKAGGPTHVTRGKLYDVAEICECGTKYSILNDIYKMSRYSISRFEVVDDSPIPSLRDNFNMLTRELRMKYYDTIR